MNGASTCQVSRNWRGEGRISTLRKWLRDTPALLLSHVKRSGNRLADALTNERVGKERSFNVDD